MPKVQDLAPLTGYSNTTTEEKLKKSRAHGTKGDWRRFRMIHDLHIKECICVWSSKNNDNPPLKTISIIPVGMQGFAAKLHSASCRNVSSLPHHVKSYFDITTKEEFEKCKLETNVTFNDPKKHYGDFYHLYCCKCDKDKLPEIWKKHSKLLPEEMNIKNLFLHWDKLNLSWMHNDILGCIIPDNPEHYVFINARHFLQRPHEHFSQVHSESAPEKKKMKVQIPLSTSFFGASSPSSSSCTSSSSSSDSVSASSSLDASKQPSPKLRVNKPKMQLNVGDMIQPTLNINHKPSTKGGIDEWAMGSMFMNVHNGVNKCISNEAILEYHEIGHQMSKDYHQCIKSSKKEFSSIPFPPKVTLHRHNIGSVQKAIYETYRWENEDQGNPYRLLEKCDDFSIMHDATSYWVKQLNTMMLKVVTDEMEIVRIPFSFKNVPSLTGEALCSEIIDVVSSIKKVKDNASEKIMDVLKRGQPDPNVLKYKELCEKLKVAAGDADFEGMARIQNEMKKLIEEHPDVNKTADDSASPTAVTDEDIIPKLPNYFKIATLNGVDKEQKVIYLDIHPQAVPTCQCGDGCATNMKAARLVSEQIGLNAPFTRCASHAASGTIRRLCTSETMCDADAKSLYENLRALLKHFSMSNKSTELLNNALSALEMNNIHVLNWGSTRMAVFLDACAQSSKIVVPLLDTIITMKIRPDETAFIGSAKGVYLLQLFSDLHKLFADQYLHKVDSDPGKILSCEAYNVALQTAEKLKDVATPLADHLLESLHEDQHRNLMVNFKMKDTDHTIRLNQRLTGRNKNLEGLKKDLLQSKKNIMDNMIKNIHDQNGADSLLGLMSVFDLRADEDYESRVEKISLLYNMYGIDNVCSVIDEWYGFKIEITYKRRLRCSKEDLLKQFEEAWPKINKLSQELHDAEENEGKVVSQYDLWKKFLLVNQIKFRYLCRLLSIMFSIPVNTGWVERAYSTLEMICQKRRNRLDVQNLKYLFFLAVLKLPVRDAFSYELEIANIGKNFPME